MQQLFADTVRQLEVAVRAIGFFIDKPSLVDLGGGRLAYRHRDNERSSLLASYLKCVRIVSSLNACLVLLKSGYVQEVYALCRAIDEFGEDVEFLGMPPSEGNEPTKDQRRYIDEYYQEEFTDPDDPLGSHQDRDRVGRRKIHAALSRLDGNPSRVQKVQQTLHKTFSGYVHAAYVHTMELFDGHDYDTHGLLGTRRIAECERQLASYIYRASFPVQLVARALGETALDKRLKQTRDQFGKITRCVSSS